MPAASGQRASDSGTAHGHCRLSGGWFLVHSSFLGARSPLRRRWWRRLPVALALAILAFAFGARSAVPDPAPPTRSAPTALLPPHLFLLTSIALRRRPSPGCSPGCSTAAFPRRARGTACRSTSPRLSRHSRGERSASRDSLCVALVSERIRPVALGEDPGALRLGDLVVLSGGPGAVPAVRFRQSLQPALPKTSTRLCKVAPDKRASAISTKVRASLSERSELPPPCCRILAIFNSNQGVKSGGSRQKMSAFDVVASADDHGRVRLI